MNLRIVVICLLFACLTATECFSQREFQFDAKTRLIIKLKNSISEVAAHKLMDIKP